MTIKLNDLRLILLSHAAGRDDGQCLPLPTQAAADASRTKRAITGLLKRGLLREVDVRSKEQAWRNEDNRGVGIIVTDVGLAAIGVNGPDMVPEGLQAPATVPPAEAECASSETVDRSDAVQSDGQPTHLTKRALVIDLLQREQGATLEDLVQANGWLPHTTRAALTGLRKQGFAVLRDKADGISRYRIESAA